MTLDPKQNCTAVQHVLHFRIQCTVESHFFNQSIRETKIGLKIQVLKKSGVNLKCSTEV